MRTKLVTIVLIAALAMATSVATAQRGRGGMGAGMRGAAAGQPCGLGIGLGLGPAAVRELSLTDNQVTQLRKIRDKFMSDTQASRDQLQIRLKEFAGLWTAEKLNESAIKTKMSQIDDLRTKIRNTMVDRTFVVMRILTNDQRSKLRNLVKTRPGFGSGMGAGLGLGCDLSGIGCPMGGVGGGRGYGGGRNR